MTKQTRRRFSPEFNHEAAQLALDQNYTEKEAAEAMNVGKSTMDKWGPPTERRTERHSTNWNTNDIRTTRNQGAGEKEPTH